MPHETFPAGVIITNGLGSDYNNIIIARFHLHIFKAEVEVTVGSGGGFAPTYYPRGDERDEPIYPREDEERQVKIKVRIGNRDVERYYFVKKRTGDVITQVLNFLNVTKTRIGVSANNFKQSSRSAIISLRNWNKKR